MVTSEPPIVLLLQRYFWRACSLIELVNDLHRATLLVPLEQTGSSTTVMTLPSPDGAEGEWLAVYTTTERLRATGAGWRLPVAGADLGDQVMRDIPGICGVIIDPDDPHALGLRVNEYDPMLMAMPLPIPSQKPDPAEQS